MNRARMRRRLHRSERGLSEIVGTLMLVVIVVSAAAILAAFVATYQQQLQKQETFTHDQSLESIHVLSLNTTVTNGSYVTFGFTIASEYVNPSIVQAISINNQPLRFFNWTDLTNGSGGKFRSGGNLNISSFEQVYIWLDLYPNSSLFSFYGGISNVPTPNAYLKFDIYTYLQNDFQRVFLPPTALAVVSVVYPSPSNPLVLFDGSTSFQGGANSSIVQWSWQAEDLSTHTPLFPVPLSGEEVQVPLDVFPTNITCSVTLTVTNSAGLVGTTSVPFKNTET